MKRNPLFYPPHVRKLKRIKAAKTKNHVPVSPFRQLAFVVLSLSVVGLLLVNFVLPPSR